MREGPAQGGLDVKGGGWRGGRQELYDLVGVLLMIRINYQHQLIMDKRRIPCLDPYLDRVNILLWPRFKVSSPRPPGLLLAPRHLSCSSGSKQPTCACLGSSVCACVWGVGWVGYWRGRVRQG